ncbi:MAG: hypothetical protein EA398_09055 [Deltaproteobacteria bacterium]|nr:MAG: hypothetical protein EA398_09055 [Deltaproteobacteria bacterium]
MTAICIIDTSILCEILTIPGKHNKGEPERIITEFKTKSKAGEAILLPLATILETGNHIGQIRNGTSRRTIADNFRKLVTAAFSDQAPFTITPLLDVDQWQDLLAQFPDWTTAYEAGLGDLTIKDVFDQACLRHPGRRVYVWSLDDHLLAFDRKP